MAHFTIKNINYITAGNSLHIFNISICNGKENTPIKCTLVADNCMEGVFGTTKTHIHSVKDDENSTANNNNGILLDPVYFINDICIKSTTARAKTKTNILGGSNKSTDNYIDIYAPTLNNDIVDLCQYKQHTYILTPRNKKGLNYLLTNLKELKKEKTTLSSTTTLYNWEISSHNIPTYLYKTSADFNENEINILSNYFKPKYNLDGVRYNFVIEVPNTLPLNVYNNYEDGNILGDAINCKNAYNATYSMEISSDSNNNIELLNSRNYIGIDKCGNIPYLKFYDNITYKSNNINSKNDINVANMIELNVNKYPFLKIETLVSINRFNESAKHKTNLYSIKINKTGLSYIKNNDMRELLRKEITHNVTEMTKQLCPAQTQLFNIYFSED